MKIEEVTLWIEEDLEKFVSWLHSETLLKNTERRLGVAGVAIWQPHDDYCLGPLIERPPKCNPNSLTLIDPSDTHRFTQYWEWIKDRGKQTAQAFEYRVSRLQGRLMFVMSWQANTGADAIAWYLLHTIVVNNWPETEEDVSAWEQTEAGQRAYRAALRRDFWLSLPVRRIRYNAAEAARLRFGTSKAYWAALSYEEQYEKVLRYFNGYTPEEVTSLRPDLASLLVTGLRGEFTTKELEHWGAMSEEARRAWIAQGGPFKLNDLAWDALPSERQQWAEVAFKAWDKLLELSATIGEDLTKEEALSLAEQITRALEGQKDPRPDRTPEAALAIIEKIVTGKDTTSAAGPGEDSNAGDDTDGLDFTERLKRVGMLNPDYRPPGPLEQAVTELIRREAGLEPKPFASQAPGDTESAPAASGGQGEEVESAPRPSPRPETLRKVAMVRKVITAWGVSKTRACKCVGIKLTTYNKYNGREELEEKIQAELSLLKENSFGDFLAKISPTERGTATGLYDKFWAAV